MNKGRISKILAHIPVGYGLELAQWTRAYGADALVAELESAFQARCRWSGCRADRVNEVWCEPHREKANKAERDRANRRLSAGLCRKCKEPRQGPTEKRPEGDPAYCAKHRRMADASNKKTASKRRDKR